MPTYCTRKYFTNPNEACRGDSVFIVKLSKGIYIPIGEFRHPNRSYVDAFVGNSINPKAEDPYQRCLEILDNKDTEIKPHHCIHVFPRVSNKALQLLLECKSFMPVASFIGFVYDDPGYWQDMRLYNYLYLLDNDVRLKVTGRLNDLYSAVQSLINVVSYVCDNKQHEIKLKFEFQNLPAYAELSDAVSAILRDSHENVLLCTNFNAKRNRGINNLPFVKYVEIQKLLDYYNLGTPFNISLAEFILKSSRWNKGETVNATFKLDSLEIPEVEVHKFSKPFKPQVAPPVFSKQRGGECSSKFNPADGLTPLKSLRVSSAKQHRNPSKVNTQSMPKGRGKRSAAFKAQGQHTRSKNLPDSGLLSTTKLYPTPPKVSVTMLEDLEKTYAMATMGLGSKATASEVAENLAVTKQCLQHDATGDGEGDPKSAVEIEQSPPFAGEKDEEGEVGLESVRDSENDKDGVTYAEEKYEGGEEEEEEEREEEEEEGEGEGEVEVEVEVEFEIGEKQETDVDLLHVKPVVCNTGDQA